MYIDEKHDEDARNCALILLPVKLSHVWGSILLCRIPSNIYVFDLIEELGLSFLFGVMWVIHGVNVL